MEALGVVDRVVSKGSGIEATKALLDEISKANRTHSEPTDWQAFAQAHIDRRRVDEAAVSDLDDRLRTEAKSAANDRPAHLLRHLRLHAICRRLRC